MERIIKLYSDINQNRSDDLISISELLSLIKDDLSIKVATERIIEDHGEDIAEGFKTNKKVKYQNDKKRLLGAVTASTPNNRERDNKVLSNGFLCVDIDENTKEELNAFRTLVNGGNVPFIHLFARSVSGAISGAGFGLVKTDMLDHLDEAKELLKCGDNQLHKETHALYVEYIEQVLKNDFGINIGKSSKSHKQARYLAHDGEAYFNEGSTIIEWRKVKKYYETVKEAKAIERYNNRKRFEAQAENISGDWQGLAHIYSEEKRGDDGFKMKAFYWGIKCNMLGVNKDKSIESFIEHTNRSESHYINQIEYVYANYQDSFGSKSHLLEKELEEVWELPAGKYLSHFGDKIKELFKSHDRISITANTSLGKNWMSNNVLVPDFNGVTVMVLSLNFKTKQDAVKYNAPNYFTGEKIQEIREAGRDVNAYFRKMLTGRKIFVNANQCPKLLNMLHEIGEDVQLIVDEIQNVSKEYRSGTYDELVTSFEHPCVVRTLVMTGTPVSGLSLQGFKVIRVKSKKSRILVNVKKRYTSTIDNIIEELEDANQRSINEAKNIRLLVRWNSKAEITEARDYLVNQGILKKEEIVLIYSGQSQEEKDLYIDRLNASSQGDESFEDCVRLILATNAVVEGVELFSNGEIVAIDVQRMPQIDVLNHVQFLDRWRKKAVKKAIVLVPSLGETRGLDAFNPYTEILEIKKDIEENIETLNTMAKAFPDIDKTAAVHAFPLLKEVAELIRWSDYREEYVINFASVVSYVYTEFNRRSSVLEAVQYIQKHYPYISYSFDNFDADRDSQNQIITETREAALEMKNNLLINIMEDENRRNVIEKALMDAIIEDLELAKKLLQKSPSETIEVLDAKKEYSYAFNNPKLYAAMKDYFGCRADMRALGFKDEDLHAVAGTNRSLFSKSRVKNFLKGYRLVDMIERAQRDGQRSLIEDKQVRLIAQVIDAIEFEKAYTGQELLKIVKETHGKRRLPFNVTAKTVVEMLNICLVGESSREGRGSVQRTKYFAVETMKGYLERYGLDMPVTDKDTDIGPTDVPF